MTAATAFSSPTAMMMHHHFKKQRLMDDFSSAMSSSTDGGDCCHHYGDGDDEFNVSDLTTSGDSDAAVACRPPLPIAMDKEIKFRHWPLPSRQRPICGYGTRTTRPMGARAMPRTNGTGHQHHHRNHHRLAESSSFDEDSLSRGDEDDFSIPPSMERIRSDSHFGGLSMIRELSPVLPLEIDKASTMPRSSPSTAALRTSSLNLPFQWTSSRNSLRQPKTNPRISKSNTLTASTPLAQNNRLKLHQYNNALFDGMERPSSFYEEPMSAMNNDFNKRGSQQQQPQGKPFPRELDLGPGFQVVARNFGIKGALQLTVTINAKSLTVHVEKGAFFLNEVLNSYVRVDLKCRPNSHHSDEYAKPIESYRTALAPRNNQPNYREMMQFEMLTKYDRHLAMTISVYVSDAEQRTRKRLLGCMTFQLKSMLRKARLEYPTEDNRRINGVGQTVICFQTFYDIDSSSTTTSKANSSSGMTLAKMRSGTFEMPYDGSSSHPERTACRRLSASGGGACLNKPSSSYHYNNGYNNHHVSNTDLTASTNSSLSSYNNRFALPSITTSDATSDCTSSSAGGVIEAAGYNSMGTRNSIDYHKLFAEIPIAVDEQQTRKPFKKNTVKRASSFTCSPTGPGGAEQGLQAGQSLRVAAGAEKRGGGVFAPLTKTITYLRHKVDSALSTSTLFPSKEDVKLWGESFDALLNHKYGCLLFRTFLKLEFSDENVDFWLECEQYRKMKEGGRKAARTARDIYDHYVAEYSPKQVNLDADTRMATKGAMETAITADIFSLAQNRVEQLMEKDSYKRFLKSSHYTDLLVSTSAASSVQHLEVVGKA